MGELELHRRAVLGMVAAGVVTFVVLRFISAPFGRHVRDGWGPTVPARAAWIVMEAPGSLAFLAFYLRGAHRFDAAPLALAALWQAHYVHRAFIFPLRTRADGKRMPALIAMLALTFNLCNAWINATWLSALGDYPAAWLLDPRFAAGAIVFAWGMSVNVRADLALIRLRAPGETGYRVPTGPLFARVSAPNYAGEIVEWLGFALAAWSPAAVAFALYTAANLVPRALDTHAWYRAKFPDYPRERRAIVPWVL